MKANLLYIILSVSITLCSCNHFDHSENNNPNDNTDASSISETLQKKVETSKPPFTDTHTTTTQRSPQKTESLTVLVLDYKIGQLTFKHNNNEYTYEIERRVLNSLDTGADLMTEERLINNSYGEEITANIRLNTDETKIVSCDIMSPNVSMFTSSQLIPANETAEAAETEMTMYRLEGSKVEFSNNYGSFEADLNDLPNSSKIDFPDSIDRCIIEGYKFKNGKIFLDAVNVFSNNEQNGQINYKSFDNYDKYCFFGTVQSVTDERAEVLLTDGKTVCDVPTYFNDGEIKEGMKVMLTLDAEPLLFSSGERYIAEYAVFYTRPEIYNTSDLAFESLAYAKYDERTREPVYTEIPATDQIVS